MTSERLRREGEAAHALAERAVHARAAAQAAMRAAHCAGDARALADAQCLLDQADAKQAAAEHALRAVSAAYFDRQADGHE